MTVRILQGNCMDTMAALPDQSVNACVTSPPYWGLRDYGTPPVPWPAIAYSPMAGLPACVEVPAMDCSLGLEPTIEAFIGHMLLVFRQVRRLLRDDGTAWVNMGDSYAGSRCGGHTEASGLRNPGQKIDESMRAKTMTASRRRDDEPIPRSDVRVPGLKPKDMVCQPWRLALALQADGWWLRQDVIWHKPNPMPESTKDRCTKSHEYLFLLAKSERYYFNQDALKEPASPDTNARYARGRSGDHKNAQASLVPGQQPQTIAQSFAHMRKPVAGWATGEGDHSVLTHTQPDENRDGRKMLRLPGNKTHKGTTAYEGGDEFQRTKGGLVKYAEKVRKLAEGDGAYSDGKSERLGRGPGWRAKNNESFDEATAVMPGERNRRSVWTIVTEGFPGAHFATFPTELIKPCIEASSQPDGWVLDPFGGSGTTGLVADRLQRNAILCELNPTYADMSKRRVHDDGPMFADIA